MRFVALAVIVLTTPAALVADGGLPRISERRGGKTISVFTSPTPPRVGIVDVSVLTLDERTGRPLLASSIEVSGRLNGGRPRSGVASTGSNKLMQAFEVEIDEPGSWRIDVKVDGEPFGFEMIVEKAPPKWMTAVWWLAWPFAAVGLYAIHVWFARTKTV